METDEGSAPLRQVPVNMADLIDAFENDVEEVSAFLDLETGEVTYVTGEVRGELETIYAELSDAPDDDEGYRAAVIAAVERRNPPTWMHDAILEADLAESGFGDRFIRVPHQDSHESYGAMEEFIETVTNPRVKHRLASAIRGRGAFSRFRDVLTSAPAERERWSAFHQDWMRRQVLEWLADEGISPREAGT